MTKALLGALVVLTTAAGAQQQLTLSLGTLYLPAQSRLEVPQPLVIFFHGAGGIETAAGGNRGAVLAVNFPTNSDPYVSTFLPPDAFPKMIREAEAKTNLKFGPLTLGCFSAGCGAVRTILRDEEVYGKTRGVVAIDGVYADFQGRNTPSPEQMAVWLKLSKDAIVGRKQFVLTHTDVESNAYATARLTADWLLEQVGLKRRAARESGKIAARTTAEAGGFLVKGFSGTESQQHLGQLSLIPELLRLASRR